MPCAGPCYRKACTGQGAAQQCKYPEMMESIRLILAFWRFGTDTARRGEDMVEVGHSFSNSCLDILD